MVETPLDIEGTITIDDYVYCTLKTELKRLNCLTGSSTEKSSLQIFLIPQS